MLKKLADIGGLYGIADAEASGGDPVAVGAGILHGGGRLVQLRCKSWPRDDVIRAARDLAIRCRAVGATFIVNDDPSIAAEAGADGVHLGQLDGPCAAARALLPAGAIVGRSTGQLDELRAAVLEADYVAFGPIFETPHLSRPKPVRGLDLLRAARALVPPGVPLVSIGGITAARVPDVRAAGADAWAILGALCQAADPAQAARSLR